MKTDEQNHIGEVLVELDPIAIERRLIELGLTRNEVRRQLDPVDLSQPTLSHHTVDKAFRGQPIRPPQAVTLAKFLGVNVLDILAPTDPRYRPSQEQLARPDWEWAIDNQLTPEGIRFPNGLLAFVCQMRHRFTVGRLGRGKYYLLSSMQSEERSRKLQLLQRHADVCHKVGTHTHIAEVLTSTPSAGEDGWWVVERWEGARSLAEMLSEKRWPASRLPGLMREIAIGIQHLHRQGVVLRELAPSHVLIREDGSVVLTDFELAKLLDGSPTVSPEHEWPFDGYRAPEVGPGPVKPTADLYSWGRILLHAALGKLPDTDDQLTQVTKLKVPKPVFAIVKACLEQLPSRRPKSIDVVLDAIANW